MEVESLTMGYLPSEDRITLLCRGRHSARLLLVTRRSVFASLKVLGDVVQREQGDKRLVAVGAETGLLEIKHQRALARVRAEQALHAEAPGLPPPPPGERRLVVRINFVGDGSRRFLVLQDEQGESTRVPLTPVQVHWFIERLGYHCRQAGWNDPAPEPSWSGALDGAPGPGRIALH